jgi:hypothetical protein
LAGIVIDLNSFEFRPIEGPKIREESRGIFMKVKNGATFGVENATRRLPQDAERADLGQERLQSVQGL